MPIQRQWLILRDFEWSPKPNVIIVYRAGQVRSGLTRACLQWAGDRVTPFKPE